MIHGLQYLLGVFRTCSDLHRKMSVRWVCKMVNLKQTLENICSLDVSASSVLVYSVCGFRPPGTSENVLGLINQVIYNTKIAKFLITFFQVYCIVALWWFSITLTDIVKCLRSGASCSSDRNRYVFSSKCSCVFHPSVSVVGPIAKSFFAVSHLGRMENIVNL